MSKKLPLVFNTTSTLRSNPLSPLTATDIVDVAVLKYLPTEIYNAGDIIGYNGELFKCTVNGTTGITPVVGANYNQNIIPGMPGGTASTVSGGVANALLYQTSPGVTSFLSPTTGVLVFNGVALAYQTLINATASGNQLLITGATGGNIVSTDALGQTLDSGKSFSTDTTFATPSNNLIPTSLAVSTYIANRPLSSLSNVLLTSPVTGDALVFNNALSKWVNGAPDQALNVTNAGTNALLYQVSPNVTSSLSSNVGVLTYNGSNLVWSQTLSITKLTVTGASTTLPVIFIDASSNNGGGLKIMQGNGTTNPVAYFTTALPDGAWAPLLLCDNPSGVAFVVNGNRNVGIRTLNPLQALEIGGTNTTIRIANASSGTGTAAIIDVNGDVRPLTSSLRYKENITNLVVDFSRLSEVRLVEYDYKASGEHDFGFIAEELAAVYPFLVNYDKDGECHSIKYIQLSAVLLKACSHLQSRLAEVESKLALLTT
jgi:hypothetical protein